MFNTTLNWENLKLKSNFTLEFEEEMDLFYELLDLIDRNVDSSFEIAENLAWCCSTWKFISYLSAAMICNETRIVRSRRLFIESSHFHFSFDIFDIFILDTLLNYMGFIYEAISLLKGFPGPEGPTGKKGEPVS